MTALADFHRLAQCCHNAGSQAQMLIQRANVYLAEPAAVEHASIVQWIGACRYVHNLGLEQRTEFGHGRPLNYLSKARKLTILRAEVDWLKAAPVHALQNALRAVTHALQRFFAGLSRYSKPAEEIPVKSGLPKVGIDRGVTVFAALSDGCRYKPLDAFEKIRDKLAKPQRTQRGERSQRLLAPTLDCQEPREREGRETAHQQHDGARKGRGRGPTTQRCGQVWPQHERFNSRPRKIHPLEVGQKPPPSGAEACREDICRSPPP
jgi:hypothetical protein